MKLLSLLLLLISLPTPAQDTEATKYAPRPILLLDTTPGAEAVMPMMFTENGQQHLEFIPSSKIKESMEKGGQPVRLGDILSLLGQSTDKINQLQAENDRLWKVAMKDAPKPDTVVVQEPAAPPQVDYVAQRRAEQAAEERDAANARRQAILSMINANANRQQNINVRVSDCTRLPALCAGR